MIESGKQIKAIQAIQDLIIEARSLAYNKTEHIHLAEFLDSIEYLPGLIVEEKDNTALFEQYLNNLYSENNCMNVVNRYNKR